MVAGKCKLQSTVVQNSLSTEKLFNGEIVHDFFIKITALLGAYDPYQWNSSFLCRRLISDSMGKFTGGCFLPGEQFILISTFPVEGEVEIMVLAENHPGKEKIAAIQSLVREFFAKEE
jgi:hypothetical protein